MTLRQACARIGVKRAPQVSRFHMTVISPDPGLRQTVLSSAAGCPAAFADERAHVSSYQEKARAAQEIEAYAKRSGFGVSLRSRIRIVADELMMNALYHAPAFAHAAPRDLARRTDLPAIDVHYGSKGEAFGIYVRDDFGSLSRSTALRYLRRASTGESELEDKPSGAGLGLAAVLQSSSEFTLTLRPGSSTEAFALFDTSRVSKKAVRCHAPQR